MDTKKQARDKVVEKVLSILDTTNSDFIVEQEADAFLLREYEKDGEGVRCNTSDNHFHFSDRKRPPKGKAVWVWNKDKRCKTVRISLGALTDEGRLRVDSPVDYGEFDNWEKIDPKDIDW